MKSIFILGTAGLLLVACSNNTNENNTPEPAATVNTTTTTATSTSADTPMPAPGPDTTGPLNQRTGAVRGTRPGEANDSRADIRTVRNNNAVKGKTTVTNAAPGMGYAPVTLDSNEMLVRKGREEEAMRRKIHENNSIDGGGQ